jgi:hypothetical protein
MHKARSLPRDQFKREVDQHLTGKDTEPTEIVYFKFYQSQIPVIEQAIDTAALMLGTDKSREQVPARRTAQAFLREVTEKAS